MASLGSLFYSLYLKDMTDDDIPKIKAKLEKELNIKIGVDVSEKAVDEVLNKLREKGKEITKNRVVQQETDKAEQTSRDIILKQLEREGRMWADIQAKKEKAMQPVNQALSYSRIQSAISLPYESASYQNAQNQLRAYYQEQERLAKSAQKVSEQAQKAQQTADNRRINDLIRITSAIQRADNAMQRLSLHSKIGGIAGPKTEQGIEQLRQYISMLERAKSSSAGMTNALNSIRSGSLTATINQANRLATEQGRLNAEKNRALALETRHKAALEKTNASMRTQDGLVSSLRNQMANVYSIYTLERFATQLIEIGGEFQKQHIALQSILGDGAKADAMFSKIKNLAIESPFTFQQLAGYTKQLAAFQIPYEELYDTTKRLADVSAGLGVDMGRIILAYGQVRSAAFLRGQEVRQFTEAGIPLLDELAKKFSQLENRVVSVGEVFDKISNREVPFEMVKEVFTDLTNEGGKFYNMQAKLSDSLSGKLAKLKDAYQIMLADIAQANNDLLGGGVDMVRVLISNWNGLMNTISSLIAAYGTYRVVMTVANITRAKEIAQTISLTGAVNANTIAQYANGMAMTKANVGAIRLLTSLQKLKVAFQSLGSAGWVGIILSALAAFGTYLYNSYQEANRLKNELDDIANKSIVSAQNEIDGYSILVEKLKGAVKGSQEYNDIIDKIQSRYGAYLGNIKAEADAYTYLKGKINEVTVALRAKAMESAREQGVSKITEKYSENRVDIYKNAVSALQSNFGISKEFASQIAAIIQSDISRGMDAGLSQGYDKAVAYIKGKAAELGMELNAPKSGGASKSVDYFRELSVLTAQENLELSEFDNILKAVIGTTTAYGIQIEKLEKSYEKEIDSIPLEAISRRKTAYLQLLEAKKSVYRDFGQEDEARAIDVEIANVTRLEDEWRSLSKEKFSAYSYFSAKEDESEIDYVERLQKELSSLEDISTKIGTMSPEAVSKAEEKAKLIREYLSLYGISAKGDKEKGKDYTAELWKKRIDLIDKALSSYKEWSKLEGKNAAANRVKSNKEFGDLFTGTYGFKLALENPTDAWKYIQGQLGNTEKQKELSLSIGVKLDKNEQENLEKEFNNVLKIIQKNIDDTTKKWGLFKSIREKTGNKKFAMQLAFGELNVGETDMLKGFREEIEKGIEGKGISFEDVLKMDEALMKDAGILSIEPYVKAYNDGMMQLRKDTADNLAELVSKYRDYATQVTEIENKLNDDLADIESNRHKLESGGVDVDKMIAERKKRANEEKGSVAFEQFKETSDWVHIFDDLDRVSNATLDSMIDKVEKFSTSQKHSVEDTKELVEALRKLRNEQTERNPFKALGASFTNIKNAKNALKNAKTDEEKEKASNQLKSAEAEQAAAIQGVISKFDALANAADFLGGVFENLGLGSGLSDAASVAGSAVGGASTMQGITSALGAAGPWGAAAGAALGLISGIAQIHDKKLDKAIERSKQRVEELKNAYDNLNDSVERFGGTGTRAVEQQLAMYEQLNEQVQRSGSSLSTSYSTVYEVLKNSDRYAEHLKEQIKAGELTARKLSKYFGTNVKLFSVEADKEALKALEDVGVGGTEALKTYQAQYVSLVAQRRELEGQLRDEESKKKSDSGKIADYQQQINELNGQIRYFIEDLAKELYAIDFDDWAGQISDALTNAFANGEDAALAFDDAVNNIMKNVANSILKNLVIAPMMEKLQQKLFGDENGNGGVFKSFEDLNNNTELAASTIKDFFDTEGNAMLDASQKFLEAFDKATGGALAATGESDTSGMSKEIQGTTEDTANLLGSYLNAMRQDVSVKRMLQEKFFNDDFPEMSVIAQAQLRQLNAIEESTRRTAESNEAILKEVSELRDDVHSAKQSKDRGFYFH